jgi:hypothetical protein
MPTKTIREDTPFNTAGKLLSIRTTVALDAAMDEFIQDVAVKELRQLDRAEAGRRLIVLGLSQWKKEKAGA